MSDIQAINNEHFNKTAEDYDNMPQVMEMTQQASDLIVQEFIDSTSEEHVRNAVVVDFGCGTGLCSFQVAPKVQRVIGIDASEGMLRHLNNKLTNREENAAIRDKVKTIHHLVTHDTPLPEQEIAKYLAQPSGGFDMIFSSFVMHHIDDVQGIVNTLVEKLLKKGGWLIIVDFEGDLHHQHSHHHQHGHGDHAHQHGHGDHAHQHGHGDHAHHHQHGHGDHVHQHGQGDHSHHQHGHGDHSHHQEGGHGHGHHHGQDIRDHFKDEDGKTFEHVAHMEGFTPEGLLEIFLKAGLVDVSAKHAYSMDREIHGKPIRSDVAIVKGRRP